MVDYPCLLNYNNNIAGYLRRTFAEHQENFRIGTVRTK